MQPADDPRAQAALFLLQPTEEVWEMIEAARARMRLDGQYISMHVRHGDTVGHMTRRGQAHGLSFPCRRV